MTASQIIDAIKGLSPKEQASVVRFAYQLDAERKLSSPSFPPWPNVSCKTEDPVEASRVRETMGRGFYGSQPDA